MTRDLTALAADLAAAGTAELTRAPATARRGYACIGWLPDQRRADCRAYFAVVDELTAPHRRRTSTTTRLADDLPGVDRRGVTPLHAPQENPS
ncbi:hypothetical protein [Paractinoplanes toevensis]|uniref:Uncharacterized protein n=1 Tax=Paractinoplanes toevensis TaxID=571911 RepID=A0A919WD59_9ACTN|nr:hypothetical protein [Actinoplanes toevensis]GIM98044.1 hypothetical protein Ato02nite_098370 [Actinoplanes toevensis]